MSKTLEASCAAGVVLVDGLPIPSAVVMSEGLGPSDGVVILDEDKAFYIAKISPDIATTLEAVIDALAQVKEALDKTASALTALDTAAFLIAADAGVPSPPVASGDIPGITAAAVQIEAAKTQLVALKEVLK